MQVLLSSIGSRGDVQPILALALELRALGHQARLCVAPNFKEWIESYGLECTPIGPDLRKLTGGSVPGKPVLPSKEQLQQLAVQTVRTQFQVVAEAARGCNLVIAGGALQMATRSIAEVQKIPYVFAAYCPAILPSLHYPPPKTGGHYSYSLPDDLENFLANGAPPIYLGFGSMQASEQTGRMLIEAARAVGLRAILSQGWADLTPSDTGDDCLSIGDVNHEKLFPQVAAIVHHGGAGTTTAAARAGRSQVIIAHNYDQFYWAHRVHQLGVGVSGPARDDLTVDGLVQALRECLQPEVTRRAQALAGRVELHGARIAAERLASEFG